MTIAARIFPIEVDIGKGDVRTIQRGKTWAQFEYLQKGFEDIRGAKFCYYNGTIEILVPGAAHELFKKIIAILIEVYLIMAECILIGETSRIAAVTKFRQTHSIASD
jgi:hypothetical protein